MKLPRTQAQDYAYGDVDKDDDFTIERNEQIGSNRWSSIHELVLKQKSTGKYWVTSYQRGLTENQDEVPFEYDGEEVEFSEAQRIAVTTYEYKGMGLNG